MSETSESRAKGSVIRVAYRNAEVLLECPLCVGSFYFRGSALSDGSPFHAEPLMIGASAVPVFDLDGALRKLLRIDADGAFPVAVALRTDALGKESRDMLASYLSRMPREFSGDLVAFGLPSETSIADPAGTGRKQLPACVRAALREAGIMGISFQGSSPAWYIDPLAVMIHSITSAGTA